MVDRSKELKDFDLLRTSAEAAERDQQLLVPAEVLAAVASSITTGLPLEHAAQILEPWCDSAPPQAKALEVAVEYGTWLSRIHKSAPDRPFVFADEGEQLQLFAAHTRSTANDRRGALIVPRGYEVLVDSGAKRNGLNSVLTILHYAPGNDEASRYTHIERRRRERPMSFDIPAAVWGFASRSRLAELAEVGGDARFLGLVVEGYEILETYRADAVRGLIRILSESNLSSEEVSETVTRCIWLAEGPLSRVSRAAQSGDPRLLEAERASLSQRVRAGAVRLPTCVGDLTAGQVRRIGYLTGLLEDSSSFQEEREVRAKIRDLGFGNDADSLAADALAASKSGDQDLFWAALEARAEGDLGWSDMLAESLGSI